MRRAPITPPEAADRRPRLIVFVKEPRPGRVKTRLGRQIGMTEAAGWFRRQTARLLRELSADPRWRLELAVTPDAAVASRCWPARLPRRAQGPGDLGARMARALREAPPGPAAVIGADIPGLGRAHAARAFALLRRADAVFGPAEDGGYWLVGANRARAPLPPGFLRGVRWSGPHALADSMATLPGRRIALADLLRDVDDAGDLRRVERAAALAISGEAESATL